MDHPNAARPQKRDRSTIPTVAFIVSCVFFTYGFKEGNTFLQWVVPAILITLSVVWTFRPSKASDA